VAAAAGAANADMVTAMRSERRTTGAFALFESGYRPFFLLGRTARGGAGACLGGGSVRLGCIAG
jgi:hypothetical protein